MEEHADIVIVGAGHGGAQAAISLRQLKFAGTIAMLSEDPDIPYDRPSLSKEYLAGERPFERMLLRPAAFWEQHRILLRSACAVTAMDPEAHRIRLSDGGEMRFGALIWAAGGRPRMLTCPGHQLAGVHTLRSRHDVDRITTELTRADRVAVIGGGYIGLEVAATLRKRGKHVTVLEALDRVLARVAGEPLSRFYEREHRAHGVEVQLGARVECIEEDAGRAAGVRLADGTLVPASMVIVGIGIAPITEVLLEAGAQGDNGVMIDEYCRTSLPDVYAIGDCAAHVNAFSAVPRMRLESVQNAADMAKTVAKALTGAPEPYHSVPWFWSSQYDLHLQTVGVSAGHDDIVVRGDPSARSFSLVYRRGGRVIALDCVNSARDFAQGRALVLNGTAPDPRALADPTIALSTLRGN